ncbi:hypothetical protein [Streptomyces sp. NPDC050485]|uniref:hypothetical protein n=1 Tax=Streptomyces sp. NPDC050485 TaxID=3365617 RepID=UPI0037A727C6
MAEPQQPRPGAMPVSRRFAPPPALCGFLLLLALILWVSYEVGGAVGPVAPGMHHTGTGSGGGPAPQREGGGMGDMGGMHGGGGR